MSKEFTKKELEEAINWLSASDIKSEYEATNKEIILSYIEMLESDIERMIMYRDRFYEKRDKVIDLMINWIGDRCFYSDDYSNSCEIIQDACFNPIKDCENCIKEYFYKKVEEDNE